ncbi:MAG: hypothetical protein ABI330_11075 [Caldimonas sp.]
MRQWLDPGTKDCVVHELPLINASIGAVRQCLNFDHILRWQVDTHGSEKMLAGGVQWLDHGDQAAQGTMRSISSKNFARRVRFFFIAYSALAKQNCVGSWL